MAKPLELTLKTFSSKLKSSVNAIRKQTDGNLQDYLAFAGAHYLKEGDSGLLSECVNACIGVPALATGKMIGYIVEASDLKAVSVTIKAGEDEGKKQKAFKREVSGSKTPREFTLPAHVWSMHDNSADKAEFDIDKSIESVIKRATKALETQRGAKQQHTLKQLVSLKALSGDDSLTVVPSAKKVA